MKYPKEPNNDKKFNNVVQRNIQTLINRRKDEDSNRSYEERLIGSISNFAGSMRFVYTHLIMLVIWIGWNQGWLGLKPFDPEYSLLSVTACLEGIFLTVFVLMQQKLMTVHSDKRSELDLQINLLTEHELTKLIALVIQVAKKAGVEVAEYNELEEITKDVLPEQVMDNLDKLNNKDWVEQPLSE